MTPMIRAAALGLGLTAIAAAAWAQDTSGAATDAPAADGNAAAIGDLSMGETGDPQVGQTYTRSEHGDWELRCVKTEEGADPCQLYQLLQDQQGNSVAEVSLFPLAEGSQAAAGATIITPLETLLPQQIRLSVDAAEPKRYPFSFCSQVGCFSRVGFTEEEVQSFRQGVKATLVIVPAAAPDQTVELDMSLNGFTAGFEAVTGANAAVAQE